MSTTFSPVKIDPDSGRYIALWECSCTEDDLCDECLNHMVNVGYGNDADLLRWLGLEVDCSGIIEARELAARCRRRLWDESRNHDPEIPGWVEKGARGATVIYCGRSPDYLRRKTEALLKIAEIAGDHYVSWG